MPPSRLQGLKSAPLYLFYSDWKGHQLFGFGCTAVRCGNGRELLGSTTASIGQRLIWGDKCKALTANFTARLGQQDDGCCNSSEPAAMISSLTPVGSALAPKNPVFFSVVYQRLISFLAVKSNDDHHDLPMIDLCPHSGEDGRGNTSTCSVLVIPSRTETQQWRST